MRILTPIRNIYWTGSTITIVTVMNPVLEKKYKKILIFTVTLSVFNL